MANKGGARPGAGRKAGIPNRKTAELIEKVAQSGLTPLEYMLSVMRDESCNRETRLDAAKAAAPYVHPRLATIEHGQKDGAAWKVMLEAAWDKV